MTTKRVIATSYEPEPSGIEPDGARLAEDGNIEFENNFFGNVHEKPNTEPNFYTDEELRNIPYERWEESRLNGDIRKFTPIVGDFASKYLKGNFANVPYFTYKVGKTMLFISLFSILLDAFNHFFWPDDEEKLPPEIAGRPHITLGHDKDGNLNHQKHLNFSHSLFSAAAQAAAGFFVLLLITFTFSQRILTNKRS